MSESTTAIAEKAPESNSRPLLTALPGSWPWAVGFLLSMSALGLSFYPALLVIIFLLARSYNKSRYDFIIQLTFFLGGYALIDGSVTLVNTSFVVFALGVLFSFLYRKDRFLKKALTAWVLYTAVLFVLALTSEETMSVQLRHFIGYSCFIYFIVPIALFAGKEFNFDTFLRTLLPYALTMCAFYILDAFVLSGWVLVPKSFMWSGNSTFYNLYCSPLSGWIVRKYPPGLYVLTLLLAPVARHYRLKWWQWALILFALGSTRTFTVISGMLLCYLLLRSGLRRLALYFAIGAVGCVAVYYIDGSLAYTDDDFRTVTPLRFYSSVNQIFDVTEAVDDEDLAEFGSGRIGQALPKLELLYNLGYEWRGFGFLDRNKTDNPKFIIENEYYRDQSESIEVATNIEITALQALINIGYIGLAVHILFLFYTCRLVWRFKQRLYYYAVVAAFLWFGMGGFEGLIYPMGLVTASFAFAITYLSGKDSIKNDA